MLLLVCSKSYLFKSLGGTAFEASALPMSVTLSKVNLDEWTSNHSLWTGFKSSVKSKKLASNLLPGIFTPWGKKYCDLQTKKY